MYHILELGHTQACELQLSAHVKPYNTVILHTILNIQCTYISISFLKHDKNWLLAADCQLTRRKIFPNELVFIRIIYVRTKNRGHAV
jgi:hypothetical protein